MQVQKRRAPRAPWPGAHPLGQGKQVAWKMLGQAPAARMGHRRSDARAIPRAGQPLTMPRTYPAAKGCAALTPAGVLTAAPIAARVRGPARRRRGVAADAGQAPRWPWRITGMCTRAAPSPRRGPGLRRGQVERYGLERLVRRPGCNLRRCAGRGATRPTQRGGGILPPWATAQE